MPLSKVRVGDYARVTIWKAEIQSRLRGMVQRVGRRVVPQQFASVAREPQFPGAWIPVEADRVAQAPGIDLQARSIRIHARDGRVTVGIGFADIARRADGNVELAVGTEGDEFPAVIRIG